MLPSLEDLRQSKDAAWLWDGLRGRVVWANAAGVARFDGQSVFDLVDRPFAENEPGIADLRALTLALTPGSETKVDLAFPSIASDLIITCRCAVHTLADGRTGLLVMEIPKVVASATPNMTHATALVSALPQAVVFCSANGHVTWSNAAAVALLPNSMLVTTHFKSDERAQKVLSRVRDAGLSATVEEISSLIGLREAKVLALRLSPENDFAVVIEDVTERRQLERQLAAEPAAFIPPLPPAEAFEQLAQSLKQSLDSKSAEMKQARPVADAGVAAAPPKVVRLDVPDAIARSLEKSGEAVVVGRDHSILFATAKAVELFGKANVAEMMADTGLWQQLSDGPTITLKTVRHDAVRSSIPWKSGPAQQVVLKKSADVPARAVAPPPPTELETVAPTPMAEAALAPEVVKPKPLLVSVPADTRQAIADDEIKALLDVTSDGIITLDKEGVILSFSAGAEAIFGRSIADVVDRPMAELLTKESRKSLRDYIAALNGPGLASVFNDGREVEASVKQGTVPLFLTLGKLQSPKSRATFCAVVRDITTWKRTEKDLREAKEAAEAASRQKSEFLARVSHELRTPLNAIMGFSEVMRLERFGEMPNDKYRAYAHDIHASGSHLLDMINDLLDLSRVEAGKLELNFTAVNLHDAIDHAQKLLADQAKQARVVVRKAVSATLPRVVADLRSMRQVMANLLSNAIKYTDAGGQVLITAGLEDGKLVLRLKDSGIGMTMEQLEAALQPFSRVDTASRERQGTGLGLPLAKALVESNRASFNLTSEVGRGTLAEIIFPANRVLTE